MTIPYGLMFLDAVAIYAGTILYAVIFYPSVYSLLHPVPKLRKLILSSAAVYSFLAVLFLLFTLFAYRGFL
ncbi:MAG: hypothetical protein ACE5IJ_10040, partial [Thermoplasmata archaeon]